MFWSEERVNYLKESWGKLPSPKIAEHLGTTPNAVIGKANRLGLPRISNEQRIDFIHAWCRAR